MSFRLANDNLWKIWWDVQKARPNVKAVVRKIIAHCSEADIIYGAPPLPPTSFDLDYKRLRGTDSVMLAGFVGRRLLHQPYKKII